MLPEILVRTHRDILFKLDNKIVAANHTIQQNCCIVNYVFDTIRALTYLVTAPSVSLDRLVAYADLGLTIVQDT
jgi:hypothetical protein